MLSPSILHFFFFFICCFSLSPIHLMIAGISPFITFVATSSWTGSRTVLFSYSPFYNANNFQSWILTSRVSTWQNWTVCSVDLFQLPPALSPDSGMPVTPSLTICAFLPFYSTYLNSLTTLPQSLSAGTAKIHTAFRSFPPFCHSHGALSWLRWKPIGVKPRLHAWPALITLPVPNTTTSLSFFFFMFITWHKYLRLRFWKDLGNKAM